MKIDLSGKTALVTGSTAGIGFAVVLRLAKAGAHVVLDGRENVRTDAAVAKLRGEVPEADVRGAAGDVGTEEGCDAKEGQRELDTTKNVLVGQFSDSISLIEIRRMAVRFQPPMAAAAVET